MTEILLPLLTNIPEPAKRRAAAAALAFGLADIFALRQIWED